MFPFIKKRPFLKDLIPNDYTDLHSHLMPGIDDGAKTIEDTIFLIKALSDIGVTRFITTPHVMSSVWENTRPDIESKLETTKKALTKSNITVPVKAAAEYLLDSNFVNLFATEELLTLKDKYVLVEMSYLNPPIQLYQIIFELQVAGYKPVLAHPERYTFYHRNFSEYDKLRNAGCLFQLNLLSVVGYYGRTVLEISQMLLKKGMIDFTGSDVHHEKHIDAMNKRILVKDHKLLTDAMSRNCEFIF